VKSCRTASVVAFGALFVVNAVGACRSSPRSEIPPVTTAHPSETMPILSGSVLDAGPSVAQPAPVEAGAPPVPARHSTVDVTCLEGTSKLEPPVCSRLFIVAAKGTVKAGADTLATGDVLVLHYPEPIEVKVAGLGVRVVQQVEGPGHDCSPQSHPPSEKTLVRAKSVPELRWAGGAMRAHLDVAGSVSPELYLGRLEGTAGVVEHEHPSSVETIIAIEASGTFTIDGKESRLGPRQVVTVPRATRHSWKPDPGSKLIAIQLYDPPGPEQRFVALAAGEKDAGADGGKH
jgi:mannose-6-phosphate isomerase-like protein (cupin superfamily)